MNKKEMLSEKLAPYQLVKLIALFFTICILPAGYVAYRYDMVIGLVAVAFCFVAVSLCLRYYRSKVAYFKAYITVNDPEPEKDWEGRKVNNGSFNKIAQMQKMLDIHEAKKYLDDKKRK